MEKIETGTPTERLKRAFMSTRAVLAAVRPSELDRPTPCASWDVRSLIDHLFGTIRWGVVAVSGGELLLEGTNGDLLTSYDETIEIALAAFEANGVLDMRLSLPIGDLSGADVMGIVTRDQFVHGWDLARAIGHETDLDPELAGELLVEARFSIPDELRGPDGVGTFGAIVGVPAGASPADQLAAFLGRSM